jgi:hypothetical protein
MDVSLMPLDLAVRRKPSGRSRVQRCLYRTACAVPLSRKLVNRVPLGISPWLATNRILGSREAADEATLASVAASRLPKCATSKSASECMPLSRQRMHALALRAYMRSPEVISRLVLSRVRCFRSGWRQGLDPVANESNGFLVDEIGRELRHLS